MIKEPSWRAKVMYIVFSFALVFGLAATVFTAVPGPAEAQTATPFHLVPGLSWNVLGSMETFTVVDDYDIPVPGAFISNWQTVMGEGSGEVEIVADGQDGNNSVTVRKVTQGDALITCDVDNGEGYTDFLVAEKKWGEISRTELTAPTGSTGNVEVGDQVTVNESVYAQFIPFVTGDPAGGARITWWLLQNDELDEAQSALEELVEQFGPDNYSYVSGPAGYGEGCGRYWWWGYYFDGTFVPVDLIDSIHSAYAAQNTTFTAAEGVAITPTNHYVTYTDNGIEPLGEGNTNMEITFDDVGTGQAEPVIVVVLAEYPLDYNGEQKVCVEYMKFAPRPAVAQVKTPQVRWAGEKIVLENDWSGVINSLDYDGYPDLIAVYHLDEASVGTLYPAGDNASLEKSDGDIWVKVAGDSPGPSNPVSEVILESEVQGWADVEVSLHYGMWVSPPPGPAEPIILPPGSPIFNIGFVVLYLAFEEIAWNEDLSSELENLNPIDPPEEPGDSAKVAFSVKGWFTSEQLPPAIDPDSDVPAIRPAKLMDCDNDGIADHILPEGRWVLPDDWVALAGGPGAMDTRPNWDLMDQAHEDPLGGEIESIHPLGPFNGNVVTVDPPGEAQAPNIGPFNTLQQWSTANVWITEATVPSSSAPGYIRNTVIPDGELTMWDAPMPQALVQFEIVDDSPGGAGALSGLDKGMLEGYGFHMHGTTTYYQSPFYAVEIPSSMFITPAGYNYDSWGNNAPYKYWQDLMLDSIIANTQEDPEDIRDVEAYTDNHGIAGVTIDPLDGNGYVVISATAIFPNLLKDAQYCTVTSNPVTATWGATALNSCIDVTKTVDYETASVGDEITYTIEVCNCGDTELEYGDILDTLFGHLDDSFSPILAPGQCESPDFSYVIQPGDDDPLFNGVVVAYFDNAGNFIWDHDYVEVDLVPIDVDIDIKPGDFPNSINLKNKGVIPVAILTTSTEAGESVDFDATTVDPETVVFAGAAPLKWALEDVDFDGDMDMILHFATQDTDIIPGDTEATLTGQTLGGVSITGTDSVRTVPTL